MGEVCIRTLWRPLAEPQVTEANTLVTRMMVKYHTGNTFVNGYNIDK
jgi:hypothetical protein